MAAKSKKSTKSKSKKSTKSKSKAKKANGTAKKPTADPKVVAAATTFARKTFKEYGPVVVVRAVAEKFKSLKRADVLGIADELKINHFTASRQFHLSRSGEAKSGL